jgi:hypothetical protein
VDPSDTITVFFCRSDLMVNNMSPTLVMRPEAGRRIHWTMVLVKSSMTMGATMASTLRPDRRAESSTLAPRKRMDLHPLAKSTPKD